MHVDRARAEEELLRDLAVRVPDRHEAHHLELAAGQPGAVGVGGRAPAEAAHHGFAERGDLARRLGGKRSGASFRAAR